jgi:hypothetical protein
MKKTLTLLSLLLAFTSFAQVPNYVPTNGLVSYWPFNGNANDESGNGNNGTVNGATLTADRFGTVSKAYSLDGSTNKISFNLNSISNVFQSNSSSTTSFWVKTSDLNGPLISMQGDGGIEYDIHIGTLADVVQSPGNYGILVRDNCCGTGNNIFGGNVTDNNWHMITIVRSNDGTLKLFKDAILEITSGSGQSGTLLFNPLYMTFGADQSWVYGSQNGCGSCNTNDQQHLNGSLDDIGIWNRALTQQEITDLYNGCQLGISLQPVDQSVALSTSSTAQFNVSSTGTAYQWQTNLGLGFQNLSNAGQYSGVATNTLSVNNLSVSNNNQQFRCIVSDASCSDTSSVAVLTVIDDLGLTEATTVVSVSPNPSQELFTITTTTPLFDAYVLYDSQGRIILEGTLTGTTTILQVATLAKGNYLLKIAGNAAPKQLVIH